MGVKAWMAIGVPVLASSLALTVAPAGAQNGFENFDRSSHDQYGHQGPPPQAPPPGTPGQGGGPGQETGRPPDRPRPDRPGGGAAGDRSGRAGDGGATAGDRASREQGTALPLAQSEGGRLPFTGLDVWLLALGGLGLMAAGFTLRAAQQVRARRRASD